MNPWGITSNDCVCNFKNSSGTVFLAWCFILNKNILFWLTITYLKPFVFSVSVFSSQIFTLKLNLRPEMDLAYAISIIKWFFGILSKTIALLNSILLVFHNNTMKISKKMIKQNLMKICLQVTYPKYFCTFCIHFFHMGNVKIFDFF